MFASVLISPQMVWLCLIYLGKIIFYDNNFCHFQDFKHHKTRFNLSEIEYIMQASFHLEEYGKFNFKYYYFYYINFHQDMKKNQNRYPEPDERTTGMSCVQIYIV